MDALEQFIRVLVARKLAGKILLLKALTLRYVDGLRWADIRDVFNAYTKYSIKDAISFRGIKASTRERFLNTYIHTLSILLDSVPMIITNDYCSICRREVKNGMVHVLKSHRDMVEYYVAKLMNILLSTH